VEALVRAPARDALLAGCRADGDANSEPSYLCTSATAEPASTVSPELSVRSFGLRRRRYWIAWAATGGLSVISRQDVAKRTCATRRSLKCWTRRDAGGSCCARSERREQQNQTQTAVAAVMATSQSFVARLESTAADARVSTVERYPGRLGCVVQYHLVPLDQSADEPTVVVHEISSVSKCF